MADFLPQESFRFLFNSETSQNYFNSKSSQISYAIALNSA